MANLCHRHIECLAACAFCGAEEETTFHALVECNSAKGFWAILKERTSIKLPTLCPRTSIEDILNDSVCSESDRCVILCGMWSLWNSRNDRKHGKVAIHPVRTIDWALDVCLQLLVDRAPVGVSNRSKIDSWEKPPPGFIKVNTDGAFSVSLSSGATGVVIRREDGSFVQASARRLSSVASALVAEAEAFRDGARSVPSGTREGVIIETDSQELVSLWRSRKEGRSEVAAILQDVQDISTNFSSFTVKHICRTANAAAHTCASNSPSGSVSVWVSQPPSFLQACLLNDC
jgi:ribonuclease HI